MQLPPYLKQGDTIAIVAPARKISREALAPAIQLIEKLGFKVKSGLNLYEESDQFAGTDSQRRSDFQEMLNDEQVKAILCARGGYGSLRVAEGLNFTGFAKNPKWIIGYSDITVFHNLLNNIGVSSLHATMPINFPEQVCENESTISLFRIISGQDVNYIGGKHSLNRTGRSEGELLGGNLSMLYSLRGTNYDIETAGKILFIEDLDEYLYHIDRMMMNLKSGGVMKNLKGLIVGGVTDMNDNNIPFGKTAEEIIREVVEEYDYPVLFGFPAGHQEPNLALLFGQKISLDISELGYKIYYI
jgi:muramoyltetrapeptide carboxypeptidase